MIDELKAAKIIMMKSHRLTCSTSLPLLAKTNPMLILEIIFLKLGGQACFTTLMLFPIALIPFANYLSLFPV